MHADAATDVLGGETMGTTWSVSVAASGRDLHALHRLIEAPLQRVVAQMSTWEADSDLSRFNRAGAGWIALPTDLFTVLACALEVASQSGGAFDPTLGPLIDLWGFGPAGSVAMLPSEAEIDAARARTGWHRLELSKDTRKARQPGGLHVDLSAIAKGYAVDLVVDTLRDAGVDGALVEVGGELFGYGSKADGTPWRVLVEADPDRDDTQPQVVRLQERAVATSGDRWHRYRHTGQDFAHTLDPRTGMPLQQAPVAVTVIASDAMRADAWATALSVLGMQAGHALARERNIAARFLMHGVAGTEVAMTPEFEGYLDA